MTRHPSDQLALAERSIDDDADAPLARQRKNATFHLAVEDVVSDLDEIERLRAHDLLDLAVAASFRGCDPDIAELSGCLHDTQRSQMLLPGQQIMDLQQIEAGHAPMSARRLDLCGAPAARRNPDFIG